MSGWFRWWRWYFRAPMAPDLHNVSFPHKIDNANFELLVDRWLAAEPVASRPRFISAFVKEDVINKMSGR